MVGIKTLSGLADAEKTETDIYPGFIRGNTLCQPQPACRRQDVFSGLIARDSALSRGGRGFDRFQPEKEIHHYKNLRWRKDQNLSE